MSNAFIAYLNSLHNLSANGSNALAESQALSPYFSELYERLPVSQKIIDLLCSDEDRVVVLTGHAGDGKSTIALDVLKSVRNFPIDQPLTKPLLERESDKESNVHIVKDMSELSSTQRKMWLNEAFSKDGSWLIVSNTGPLLQSLKDYGETTSEGCIAESQILDCLDATFELESIEHCVITHFKKPLTIINLTKLDNASLGAKILGNLIGHSGWAECEKCAVASVCPINLNRNALYQARETVEERVRWMYTRIGAYEKRLTIRQMVAQLSLSITGGTACMSEARYQENQIETNQGLQDVLFSEIFFGNRDGKPWPETEGLEAIAATQKTCFGGTVNVKFEREIAVTPGLGWAVLPMSLEKLESQWRSRAAAANAVRWRYALRRMAYMFGTTREGKSEDAMQFLDGFLQSPTLRDFDLWQQNKRATLTKQHSARLRTSCLRFLLEAYSGFSPGQFIRNDKLYITLRRPDQSVIQPTQLVIKRLDSREFELDLLDGVLKLVHRPSKAELILTLPLLDLIQRRDQGELGSGLSPIHQARIDRFRAELLATDESNLIDNEIELLRATLDGQIGVRVIMLDEETTKLALY